MAPMRSRGGRGPASFLDRRRERAWIRLYREFDVALGAEEAKGLIAIEVLSDQFAIHQVAVNHGCRGQESVRRQVIVYCGLVADSVLSVGMLGPGADAQRQTI